MKNQIFKAFLQQNPSPFSIESTLILKIDSDTLINTEIFNGEAENFTSKKFKRILDRDLAKSMMQGNVLTRHRHEAKISSTAAKCKVSSLIADDSKFSLTSEISFEEPTTVCDKPETIVKKKLSRKKARKTTSEVQVTPQLGDFDAIQKDEK